MCRRNMDECEYLKSSNSKTMNNIERECSIGNCIKIDQTKYIFLQKVINSYLLKFTMLFLIKCGQK